MSKKKSNKEKGVGVTPTPSLQQLLGDLAIMDSSTFQEEYHCSMSQYNQMIEQFGVQELVGFLECMALKIINKEIVCEPSELREMVIRGYNLRIIKLNLYEYEKKGCYVINVLGHC